MFLLEEGPPGPKGDRMSDYVIDAIIGWDDSFASITSDGGLLYLKVDNHPPIALGLAEANGIARIIEDALGQIIIDGGVKTI